jgi:tRNA pseudouridine38-40 synthase
MRTLKLTLSYDGTDFSGWQVRPNQRTVQGVLSDACTQLFRTPIKPTGAGRTDAGVHALGQVASLETDSAFPLDRIRDALNGNLPGDVSVVRVEEAPEGFNARFSAKSKHYRYRILDSRVPDPHERRTSWQVKQGLDIEAVRAGAAHLVGEHDFASLAKVDASKPLPGAEIRSTVRTLYSVDAIRLGNIMALDVRGDGFLYNMVRAIAGTLVEVGRGRRPPGWVGEALAARDRSAAGPTAPPQGLFLVEVVY